MDLIIVRTKDEINTGKGVKGEERACGDGGLRGAGVDHGVEPVHLQAAKWMLSFPAQNLES